MTRILILVFMFNAFMLPVSAAESACKMMGDSSSTMMKNMAISNDQSDMSCDMHGDVACATIDCVSSCAISITPLPLSEIKLLINVAGSPKIYSGFVYFYKIVLPIETPPPLV